MNQSQLLIIGSNGQLGRALISQYPEAVAVDQHELDITNSDAIQKFAWSNIKVIINAAAYTNVDGAETQQGRISAWQVNAIGAANLAHIAMQHSLTLVHVSTDYVFDGHLETHLETEQFSPLNVYGQSKAAGDIAVSLTPQHYIMRTSWVIGEGKNFVRTMLDVGKQGINPKVVSDQIGRLTFTSELVRAIDYLLSHHAAYGTYNLTNSGISVSWADITRLIFKVAGYNNTVSDITTQKYYKDKPEAAIRPLNSTLDLNKITHTGFQSITWQDDLVHYVKQEFS